MGPATAIRGFGYVAVVTAHYKDPGEDLQVNKQSTVKPCIRALLQWAAAMIKVVVRRSAEHVIIHEPSYTTCMTCNWKINSNVLGISTPPSPGALWARRRTLRLSEAMQETKSYDRPTEGSPSFSSVAAMIQLKQIRTAYHVHSWFVTTAEQVLTTAVKHARYSLHISKAFIDSLTEDQSNAGSSQAKVNATHAGEAIESASVKVYVGHSNGLG